MTDAHWTLLVLAGMVMGVFVGMVGTSGAVLIPAMVFVFGLSQIKAQGTALFIAAIPVWFGPMLPYARAGNINVRLGLLLGVGLCVGGYFGAQLAQMIPVVLLRRSFAVVLILLATRMLMQR